MVTYLYSVRVLFIPSFVIRGILWCVLPGTFVSVSLLMKGYPYSPYRCPKLFFPVSVSDKVKNLVYSMSGRYNERRTPGISVYYFGRCVSTIKCWQSPIRDKCVQLSTLSMSSDTHLGRGLWLSFGSVGTQQVRIPSTGTETTCTPRIGPSSQDYTSLDVSRCPKNLLFVRLKFGTTLYPSSLTPLPVRLEQKSF